jgi:putative spermidine/putrescine transport system substrate-binding protein
MKREYLKKASTISLVAVMAISLSACGTTASASTTKDYSSMSLTDLTAEAKKEGLINSVGMPDTWANWIQTWGDLKTNYGLNHTDMDMSSSEEIAMFKEEGSNATKDIGDVGQQWGPVAKDSGVTMAYKTSTWNDIPDWAKDPDGNWVVAYYGTMSIITNNKLVPDAPKSFADILKGDYKVTIGDVTAASQAQHAILASAYAMGGSIDNLQPGYDFWTTLAKQGRLDVGETSVARIESGEIAVGMFWDYNALGYRDNAVKNNPDSSFTVNIPSDGSVQSGYCTIINSNAPHPAAACLAREYILSDAGQINLARGYATPIRNVTLPADVQAKRIDKSQYGSNVHTIDYAKWTTVCQDVITYWQENIIPVIH